MNDFEFKVFGVVLVRHVTGDDALEKVFVYTPGGDVVYNRLHTLHEVVGVPIISVMNEKPHTDCQGNTLVGILEIMAGA